MDIKLHVQEQGEGFPLILLHGNGESCRYFKRQMPWFSPKYRVIAPDTRGHGDSPRGSAPLTLVQFAEDLKDFLDRRGICRCHLLGFSDGANIAMIFALKYPQYIDRLVLSGGNRTPGGMKLAALLPVTLSWLALGIPALFGGKARRRWELLNLMTTQPRITLEQLGTLRVKTLVVAGEKDMIREKHTRTIAAAIPGSRLEILPGDHFVARRNSEVFNRLVEEFLEEAQ